MATALVTITLERPTIEIGFQSTNSQFIYTVLKPSLNAYMDFGIVRYTPNRPTLTAILDQGSVLSASLTPSVTLISRIISGRLLTSSIVPRAISLVITAIHESQYTSIVNVRRPSTASTISSSAIITANISSRRPSLVTVLLNANQSFATDISYVFNTLTTATSTYSNYNFNSYFKLGSKYYGVADTGIFELTGSVDITSVINSEVHVPISSFDKQGLKACSDAIIFGRLAGDMEVVVVLDEQEERGGFIVTSDDRQGLHRIRVKIPKGLKGSSWQYKLKNVDGSDFSINNFEVFLRELSRIR